jgi:hypothetical protein
MFSEPIAVTIGAATTSLRRVTMEKFRSGWGDPSGPVSMTIAHSLTGNEQSQVRLDLKKVIDDPFSSGDKVPVQASAWLVIRAPQNQVGFTDAELGDLGEALADLVKSDGFLATFLNKES